MIVCSPGSDQIPTPYAHPHSSFGEGSSCAAIRAHCMDVKSQSLLRRHHRPGKRSFEDEGEEEQRGSHSLKARRLITAARHSTAAAPAHVPVTSTSSIIAGLRSLYPAMNEQVAVWSTLLIRLTCVPFSPALLLTCEKIRCQSQYNFHCTCGSAIASYAWNIH